MLNLENAENIEEIIVENDIINADEAAYESADGADEIKTAEDEAVEAWRDFLKALLPYLKISAEMCVKNISKTVMLKVSYFVNEENTFTINDEAVFVNYSGLMKRYAEIIAVYSESLSDINDARIAEILRGVSEILCAQLKSYEEYMGVPAGGSAAKNPISEEKERILRPVNENVANGLKAVLGNIIYDSGYFDRNELHSFCAECAGRSANESHIDVFSFIYQRIIEKGGLDIYKSYSGAIMECKNTINSLDLRKEARFFCEALKQEKENLDSIVKIQVAALEECYADLGMAERFGVERIIEYLAETRDIAARGTEELDRVFAETESVSKIPMLANYDDFLTFVEEKGLCAYTDRLIAEGLETGTLSAVQYWKEKLDIFIRKFSAFVDEHIEPSAESMQFKRFLYEARLKMTDKLILTDEMLKGVMALTAFYAENADRLRQSVPEELMKIIDGINESVLIKIDVLAEGKESFISETDEKLADFVPPERTDDDKRDVFTLYFDLWRDEMQYADVFSPDYLNEAGSAVPRILKRINEIGDTGTFRAKLDRTTNLIADAVIKLESAYLRDCLLFEIITFEEILAYSVSKLKESGNEEAAEYAAACDRLEETMIKLCKLHNILIISPKPYDIFNSSEHEVLVAEKTDGYKKGQIIKLMNSGFKYNDAVLVRANVIAAK